MRQRERERERERGGTEKREEKGWKGKIEKQIERER